MASTIEEASVPTIVLKEGACKPSGGDADADADADAAVTIQLTEQEELVFQTILQATAHLEQEGKHSHSGKVQVRIVGGWVRDKLLGISTHDVTLPSILSRGFNLLQPFNRIST